MSRSKFPTQTPQPQSLAAVRSVTADADGTPVMPLNMRGSSHFLARQADGSILPRGLRTSQGNEERPDAYRSSGRFSYDA